MNITCPSCNSRLNLPDDKIPKHRDSSFKCPKCKGPIQVKASQKDPDAAQDIPAPQAFARSGRAQALVCTPNPDLRKVLLNLVKQAGLLGQAPESVDQALGKLEYQMFPLMILDEVFDPDKAMVRYMNAMDMSLRRRICLVRLGLTVNTGDPMAALHASANCVINTNDLNDIALAEDILATALAEHKNVYTIFNDSLKTTGKA